MQALQPNSLKATHQLKNTFKKQAIWVPKEVCKPSKAQKRIWVPKNTPKKKPQKSGVQKTLNEPRHKKK